MIMQQVATVIRIHAFRGSFASALFALLLLGGCASTGYRPSSALQQASPDCRETLAAFFSQVAQQGHFDAQGVPLQTAPSLRVNRFLASFDLAHLNPMQRREWLKHAANLARQARDVELAQLHPAWSPSERQALEFCSEQSLRALQTKAVAGDLADALGSIAVPDDYVTWQRAVGLYALLKSPVQSRIDWLNRDLRRAMDVYDWQQTVQRYLPPASAAAALAPKDVAAWMDSARAQSSLDIPQFSEAQWQALFERYAPTWELETASDADYPVRPWRESGEIRSEPQALVYQQRSFTRFAGWVLPQLSYVIWFSERPKPTSGDLYGGRLDSLIWRVTLDPQGRPLVYDSIHSCGCYHLWVRPNPALALRTQEERPAEFVIDTRLADTARLRLRVQAGTHYLLGVREDTAPSGLPYQLRDYAELRQSGLFDESGLVSGSERRERYLLWPMGVPSAGAMRQWGHHAIAFIGRQHFDDADLLEQVFIPALPLPPVTADAPAATSN